MHISFMLDKRLSAHSRWKVIFVPLFVKGDRRIKKRFKNVIVRFKR